MDEHNPREFWELVPEHPLQADGLPMDEYIGGYHIKFGKMRHEVDGTEAPSFELHDAQHHCLGHLHTHRTAQLLCVALGVADTED